MKTFFEVSGSLLLLVVGACVVIGCMYVATVFIDERIRFPSDLAAIEQLRADYQVTQSGSDEDAVGEVLKTNQFIRSQKAYRQFWWSRVFIPSGWDKIELIDVRRER